MPEATGAAPRLAVTGASGFLGRALCRLAAEDGCEVVAVVRRPCDVDGATQVVATALEDTSTLPIALQGCAAVVHTAGLAHIFGPAAQHEEAFEKVNVRGTEAVAHAAVRAGVQHFVLASSVSVYGGARAAGATESSPAQPRTPYARSKWRSEKTAGAVFADRGALTILRFATLYGGENDRGNVARLIQSLRQGRFIWPGSGGNRKSLIACDDAARACLAAVRHAEGGVFNVSAEPVSMREIVETICEALGRPGPRLRIPDPAIRLAGSIAAHLPALQPRARQLQTFLNDDVYLADSFRERFGWKPQVSLREGILRQVKQDNGRHLA